MPAWQHSRTSRFQPFPRQAPIHINSRLSAAKISHNTHSRSVQFNPLVFPGRLPAPDGSTGALERSPRYPVSRPGNGSRHDRNGSAAKQGNGSCGRKMSKKKLERGSGRGRAEKTCDAGTTPSKRYLTIQKSTCYSLPVWTLRSFMPLKFSNHNILCRALPGQPRRNGAVRFLRCSQAHHFSAQ